MTISELASKRISTITHPSLGGNGRLKIHITDDGHVGPWVEVHDDATDSGVLEPPKIIITELPDDDKYQEFVS